MTFGREAGEENRFQVLERFVNAGDWSLKIIAYDTQLEDNLGVTGWSLSPEQPVESFYRSRFLEKNYDITCPCQTKTGQPKLHGPGLVEI